MFFSSDKCTCKPPYVVILLDNTTPEAPATRLFTNTMHVVNVKVNMGCKDGIRPSLRFACDLIFRANYSTFANWTGPQKHISRKTLKPLKGDFRIKCHVNISGGPLFDSAYVDVQFVWPPLLANFTERYVTIRRRRILLLDASSSFDPHRNTGLKYKWFCRLVNETFPEVNRQSVDKPQGRNKKTLHGCFGYGPGQLDSTRRTVSINVKNIEKNQSLVFMLFVWKDDRNATTFLNLSEDSGQPLR